MTDQTIPEGATPIEGLPQIEVELNGGFDEGIFTVTVEAPGVTLAAKVTEPGMEIVDFMLALFPNAVERVIESIAEGMEAQLAEEANRA